MGIASSLLALSEVIDPSQSYWSCTLSTGKQWSEKSLVPTFTKGIRGFRHLDWAVDIVATGDIHKMTVLTLNCPDGHQATLQVGPDRPPFQFKTTSMQVLSGPNDLECQVIGRVTNLETGACDVWAWDYRSITGIAQLIAYKSTIYNFGAWRSTMMPIGALSLEVQGFRL